jgi:hypothetical protein
MLSFLSNGTTAAGIVAYLEADQTGMSTEGRKDWWGLIGSEMNAMAALHVGITDSESGIILDNHDTGHETLAGACF